MSVFITYYSFCLPNTYGVRLSSLCRISTCLYLLCDFNNTTRAEASSAEMTKHKNLNEIVKRVNNEKFYWRDSCELIAHDISKRREAYWVFIRMILSTYTYGDIHTEIQKRCHKMKHRRQRAKIWWNSKELDKKRK